MGRQVSLPPKSPAIALNTRGGWVRARRHCVGAEGRRFVDTLTCYEEFAERYDQWEEFETVTRAEQKVLLSLIEDAAATDVLDIGCGTGRYAKRFEDLRARVVGVDISRKMIQVAKTKTREVSYVVADGSQLVFKAAGGREEVVHRERELLKRELPSHGGATHPGNVAVQSAIGGKNLV